MRTLVLVLFNVCLISGVSVAQSWNTIDKVDSLIKNESLLGISSIHANESRVFVSSYKADFSVYLYYSEDGGENWVESETPDKSATYALFSNNSDSVIYAWGTSLFGARQVKKSVDNGTSWSITSPGNANFSAFFNAAKFASISDTLIITSTARSVGMLKSVDGGINWEKFDSFSDGDGNKSIESVFSYKNNFYLLAGSNGEGLFKSHRDSSSWQKVYPQEGVSKSVDRALVTKSGRLVIAHSNGIDYSDDEGETWVEKSREDLGIGASGTIARMINFGEDILLSIQDASEVQSRLLLINSDITESTNISEGLTGYSRGTELNFIVANDNQIFGTRFGQTLKLWSYGEAPTGVNNVVESEFGKDEFKLSQNYPNPFNPSTNISFNLPSSGDVSLKVYNLLGQEVASLVNGRMNSGSHTVSFDASSLASGMYIYQLQAGSHLQTRKMLLIK
tara:strand:+ start:42859 stop:44208 length:1350 start_codon:yes stop_codon:yes gene_type:complete